MKKYTLRYDNIKHNETVYPVSSNGYGASYCLSSNIDNAWKYSCQKGCARCIGRTFAVRIFHDLYCFFNGDFVPGLCEHDGYTWKVIEIEEEPDAAEMKCLDQYCLNKSYLDKIQQYTEQQLAKLLSERKPGKTYMY